MHTLLNTNLPHDNLMAQIVRQPDPRAVEEALAANNSTNSLIPNIVLVGVVVIVALIVCVILYRRYR